MADLLGKSWGLETPDLLQQMAMLAWMNQGEEGKELLNLFTKARVGYELFNRVSGQRAIEEYEQQCILAIADYVKKNPKATQDQLAKEVQKQIQIFQQRIDSL